MDDFRVDGHDQAGLLVLGRNVDHNHPLVHPDLGSGEAHAWSIVHGLDHVTRQIPDLVVDYGNRS